MDHSPSLVRPPSHRDNHGRRRSLSQSIAAWSSSSSRRMTVWIDNLSHPKSVQHPPLPHPPQDTPSRPGTGVSHQAPRPRFRIAHLSFSTPSLLSTPFQPLPPTPPPSPPESFDSMDTTFHKSSAIEYTTRLYTPPDSQSSSTSDLRRIHSRTRSLSATLNDSLSLIGRRSRRSHTASSPASPPSTLNIQPPIPPKTRTYRKPVPPTPPLPQLPLKHVRAATFPTPIVVQKFESTFPRPRAATFPTPIVVQKFESAQIKPPQPQMEVARTRPLRVVNRSLPSPTSGRRGRVPGSPVRMGIARTTRAQRRTIMLQPSENESREFTKANTLQVQKRLAEVEAARLERVRLMGGYEQVHSNTSRVTVQSGYSQMHSNVSRMTLQSGYSQMHSNVSRMTLQSGYSQMHSNVSRMTLQSGYSQMHSNVSRMTLQSGYSQMHSNVSRMTLQSGYSQFHSNASQMALQMPLTLRGGDSQLPFGASQVTLQSGYSQLPSNSSQMTLNANSQMVLPNASQMTLQSGYSQLHSNASQMTLNVHSLPSNASQTTLDVSEMDGVRDSYTSLDVILSSYASSDESTDTTRPWRGRSGPSRTRIQQKLLAPLEGNYAHLGTPPPYQLALITPTPVRQLRRPGLITKPPTPPKEWQNYGKDSGVSISTSPSSRSLDIETAFSSLGGFGSGGIWRKIGVLLEPWDLARLARVSKRVKRVVEPLLYESISLRPNYPHGFSYSYLCHLLASLHTKTNRPKLQKWTKSFHIEKGWEENQISLLDNGAFLMDEEIIDPKTNIPIIDKTQMKTLMNEEGLLGDGGTKEVNAYISDLLERMPNLTSFTWDSSIPLRGQLITTLSTTKITHLSLNLSQPMRKERKDDSPNLQWAHVSKYRPNIAALAALPLVELRLCNLPTRGGEWWRQVWYLIAASINTLRVLKLEMPHITHERYRDLFDRYYRIYHVPEHDEDERHLKTPPVFDWVAFTAAKKALGVEGRRLQLHTLELTGFVVDEKILNWEMTPGKLKRVSLLGCIEKAGFRITKDCWRGIEVFRSTGLGFIERVVEALYTSGYLGPLKEVAFLTDVNEHTEREGEREALDVLRKVVINAFPRCGGRLNKLVLKEQWALNREELEKIFALEGGANELVEIAVAVENTIDAWKAFLEGIGRCKKLKKIHVLNGFSQRSGSGYGINASEKRRFVVDDAKLVGAALVQACEAGSGAELDGFVVAVSRAAWRIVKMDHGRGAVGMGAWGMERISGALEEVLVGR